jgi:hypothetical protein
MATTQANRQKRTAVEHLRFGAKTAKRVTWEDWEFTVAGPHLVRVTNASYGYLKDEHAYLVGVEERDGLAVPAECECPADLYSDDYDCKHKVALATVGGPTVLNAALEADLPSEALPEASCPNGDRDCEGPDAVSLPCFECYCDRGEVA